MGASTACIIHGRGLLGEAGRGGEEKEFREGRSEGRKEPGEAGRRGGEECE